MRAAFCLLLLGIPSGDASLPASGGGRENQQVTNPKLDKEPEFIAPIKNVTVPLGKEAVLTCSVNDLGNYRLGWIKAESRKILTLHNRVVTNNNRISVTNDDSKIWRLHIRQVRNSDQGCYMCQVNTRIMKMQIGCVDVFVPPDIKDETASDVSVIEGGNCTLSCVATGHPQPRILWKREDGAGIVLRMSSKNSTFVDTYQGETLPLTRVNRLQMGYYLCIASNDVPPAVSKRITLHVNFAPMVKVKNTMIGAPLGTEVQMECNTEAYPYAINYWVKSTERDNKTTNVIFQDKSQNVEENRNTYKVSFKLTLKSLALNETGVYTCISTNSLGQAEGSVRIYEIKLSTTTTTTTTTTTRPTTTATTMTATTKRYVSTSTSRPKTEKPPPTQLKKDGMESNSAVTLDSKKTKIRSKGQRYVNEAFLTSGTFRIVLVFSIYALEFGRVLA